MPNLFGSGYEYSNTFWKLLTGMTEAEKSCESFRMAACGCTPACVPGAVAVRLLEQWKIIVICCSNKNNAVCIPRNFWKSQQIWDDICNLLSKFMVCIWGVSAVKKGEAEAPREAYPSPASWWRSQLIHECGFSLSCPVSLGWCTLQLWDR